MGFFYRNLVQPALFRFDPERAHELVARASRSVVSLPLIPRLIKSGIGQIPTQLQTTVAGIRFPGPVGMAAGFDKDGALYPFLSLLGFGHIESGTFTALAQPGNPRPRVFRFPETRALVNRMGFNNPGAMQAVEILRAQNRVIPRGINIGKSKVTELEVAGADYLRSLTLLEGFADYIAVNVSSPNTPGLRSLQSKDALVALIEPLLNHLRGTLPLFVKLSPDMAADEYERTVETLAALPVSGLILTNTTLDRSRTPAAAGVEGGLSGAPMRGQSTAHIRRAYQLTGGKLPIIGVGGIMSGADALEKILAGASLVQVYTGFIYEGPALLAQIHKTLLAALRERSCSMTDLVGAQNDRVQRSGE